MSIDTDYLITLADMSEDALYTLYTEAMSKLKSKETSQFDRKVFVMRVMTIRSIISDKYSLKLRHSIPDNPMDNPEVARFYK